MSRKPRSYCVVPYGGALRRLVTVIHKPDGGLNITSHVSGLNDISRQMEIHDRKFSVHPSSRDRDGNNLIHGTTQFPDGSKHEAHLYTSGIRNGGCVLFNTRAVAHPRLIEGLKSPGNWPVIELPPYNPERCTMCYQLWVCSPDTGQKMVQLHASNFVPYSVWFGHFRRFTMYMPICYFPVPSIEHDTEIFQFTTSEERQTAEQKQRGIDAFIGAGLPPPSVPAYVIWRFNNLLNRKHWFGEHRKEGPPPNEFQFPKFTYRPII